MLMSMEGKREEEDAEGDFDMDTSWIYGKIRIFYLNIVYESNLWITLWKILLIGHDFLKIGSRLKRTGRRQLAVGQQVERSWPWFQKAKRKGLARAGCRMCIRWWNLVAASVSNLTSFVYLVLRYRRTVMHMLGGEASFRRRRRGGVVCRDLLLPASIWLVYPNGTWQMLPEDTL